VQALVAECLGLLEDGGEEAVECLLREHPERADEVREHLRRLEEAGLVAGAAAEAPMPPERLGPFRLLRPLGSGGMGVVYLAEQEPLGRTVALKIVRPELVYFEGARTRFRREVEVAARLKHPGIVQVYTFGDQDGIPYFAMEYVEGRSLAEVLRGLRGRVPATLDGRDLLRAVRGESSEPLTAEPGRSLEGSSWVDACFRLLLQLAEVMAHAHGQGVLHRDVKPSNVMLTPDGRALLLDFGLASTRGGDRLTRTGSQVGSLAYMAPEQLRGEEVDERSDLYAFGVTLYELLTLRLPHVSTDPEETRRLILDGNPAPPQRENPAIPADAATVCLTAMDPEPGRRYPSATAFAADLRAILERRPIAARPPGPLLRMRRWGQRHPARAVGLGLGLVLFAATGAFALHQASVSRSLELAVGERDALVRELRAADAVKTSALQEAQRGLARSLRAANEMLRGVGHETLSELPGAELVRRELLESAASLYEELLGEHPDDALVRREAALGFGLLSNVLTQVGETDRAVAAARRAVEMMEELHGGRPGDLEVLEGLADAYATLANALQDSVDQEERRRSFVLAARYGDELLESLEASEAPSERLRMAAVKRAGKLGNLGMSLSQDDRYQDSREMLVATRLLFHRFLEQWPDDSPSRHYLTTCDLNLSGLLLDLGEYGPGLEVVQEGLAIGGALIEDEPGEPIHRIVVAGLHSNHGAILWRQDRREEAVVAMEEAAARLEALVENHPHTYQYRVQLAGALVQGGSMQCGASTPGEETLATLERAIELADGLVADFPASPDAHFVLVRAWSAYGHHCNCEDRPEEAEASLRLALELLDEMESRWAEHGGLVEKRAMVLTALAGNLADSDQFEEARECAELAVSSSLVEGSAEIEIELGVRLGVLGRVALAQGDHARVREIARRLTQVVTNPEEYTRVATQLAACWPRLAESGEGEQAHDYAAGARELLEIAFERGAMDSERLREDPDFAPLRDWEGFSAWVGNLETRYDSGSR